ncbi:hypothetical protein CDIK_1512 [Cucumispora dikerogammari]|nr:hypothetical protein CDIK_1512 [Cucumispora dikerogammari]
MASISSVNRAIVGFAYSLKRIYTIPERRNCHENIELRYLYAQNFVELQGRISENKFVFIDEVSFSVSMRTSRGRFCSWTTAVLQVPALQSRNISICCAIHRGGVLHYETSLTAYNSVKY